MKVNIKLVEQTREHIGGLTVWTVRQQSMLLYRHQRIQITEFHRHHQSSQGLITRGLIL